MVESESNVTKQAASGVVWLTLQKWVIRFSGIFTIAILTRFLTPEDFGVVAAASTVLPFFMLLADLGFGTYIVQADDADEEVLSTGFWFSLTAGIVLTAGLVAIAPLLGWVFRSDQVIPVLQVLALSVLLLGISSVPGALLRRRMEFKRLAAQGTAAALVAQAVAVGMTLGGLGVWALVGQTLASPIVQGVLAWISAKWRPTLTFSFVLFRKMTHFGSQVLGVEFIAMARAWAEAAIVSAALGLPALGFLNIAQRLIQVVQDLTGSALAPVSMVAFAKIRDSVPRLCAAYLRSLRLIYAALSAPLTLVAVAAPLIIPILFGAGWDQSNQVAQLLALAGIMTVGAALDHGLYYGTGKPGQWFVYALLTEVATVAMTAYAVRWGLVGVGAGFLVVASVATVGRWFLVARILRSSPRVIARPFGFLAPAVLASGAGGWLVLLASAGLDPMLRVVLIGLTILLIHLVVVRLLARPVVDEIIVYVKRLWQARRKPVPPQSEEA